MMEQVRLCAVWPMENWFCPSLNHIQGWTTVRESYSRALEQDLCSSRSSAVTRADLMVVYGGGGGRTDAKQEMNTAKKTYSTKLRTLQWFPTYVRSWDLFL